jgi:hypothetical protein
MMKSYMSVENMLVTPLRLSGPFMGADARVEEDVQVSLRTLSESWMVAIGAK